MQVVQERQQPDAIEVSLKSAFSTLPPCSFAYLSLRKMEEFLPKTLNQTLDKINRQQFLVGANLAYSDVEVNNGNIYGFGTGT